MYKQDSGQHKHGTKLPQLSKYEDGKALADLGYMEKLTRSHLAEIFTANHT